MGSPGHRCGFTWTQVWVLITFSGITEPVVGDKWQVHDSQLISHRISTFFDKCQIILLGVRDIMTVNNLPRVIMRNETADSPIHNFLIAILTA